MPRNVKKADEVKPEAAAKTAEKAVAETAEKKTATKTAAKKPAEKAAPKKTAAKKTTAAAGSKTVSTNVYIQWNGAQASTDDIVEKAKKNSGVKNPKKIDIYVRPDIDRVYYVIDNDPDGKAGDFELF